jgi:two-component system OmpR family sensor kinase
MGGQHGEMGRLGQDFDRMAKRLRLLTDSERKLLHDVSHKLRFPLARSQMAIGRAHQQPVRSALMLDRIERKSVHMDQLVVEILTLSWLELTIAQPPQAQQKVDMDGLLSHVAEDAAFEADLDGWKVRYAGP